MIKFSLVFGKILIRGGKICKVFLFFRNIIYIIEYKVNIFVYVLY